MELYDTRLDQQRKGVMSQTGLVLLIAAVVAVIGAAIWWVVWPAAGALWRTWVAPIIESVRRAIGA